MAASLILHEQMVAAPGQGQDLERVMDRCVTLASAAISTRATFARWRMGDEAIVKKLFDAGSALQGPCRRLHARAQGRLSTTATSRMAVIKLVDRDESIKGVADQARSEAMKEAAAGAEVPVASRGWCRFGQAERGPTARSPHCVGSSRPCRIDPKPTGSRRARCRNYGQLWRIVPRIGWQRSNG